MKKESKISILVAVDECMNPILDELSRGKFMSYYMVKMKMDIMGFSPDEKFLYTFISLAANEKNVKLSLVDCINHGMFVEMFKKWNVFEQVLLLQNEWFMRDVSNSVIYSITRLRPGLIIGHFLKHGEVRGKTANSDIFFTDLAFRISSKMSCESEEYKNTYHEKVLSVVRGNWNIESIMN